MSPIRHKEQDLMSACRTPLHGVVGGRGGSAQSLKCPHSHPNYEPWTGCLPPNRPSRGDVWYTSKGFELGSRPICFMLKASTVLEPSHRCFNSWDSSHALPHPTARLNLCIERCHVRWSRERATSQIQGSAIEIHSDSLMHASFTADPCLQDSCFIPFVRSCLVVGLLVSLRVGLPGIQIGLVGLGLEGFSGFKN